MEFLIFGATLFIGLVAGWMVANAQSRRLLSEARDAASRVLNDAKKAADLNVRESEAKIREDKLKLDETWDSEQRLIQQECLKIEERIKHREERNKIEIKAVEDLQNTVKARDKAVSRLKQESNDIRNKVSQAQNAAGKKLEERAGQTAEEIRDHLIDVMLEEVRLQCADRLRNLEADFGEELDKQAKRVMGIAIQRYAGHCVRDRASSVIPLPEGLEKVVASNPKNLEVLKEISGVNIQLSEDQTSLRLDTGDGMARELCRRALARFMSEKTIRDPERLANAIRADLKREIIETGRKAFQILRLDKAAPEIFELVGKLNFRTSYTQNQWQHAIEAAFFADLMAAELGLDREIARRGALLHDIGKALTHEVEGSHALLGAEIARRNGEDERIVNAIAFHHGEEPAISPYALLVAAADAISGARPGARREMSESYGERIEDLEKIAGEFKGVVQVYAVQAGRELRVHVDDKVVTEAELAELSKQIAEKISKEMIFPGQIRVTAIREFCAVEYAN